MKGPRSGPLTPAPSSNGHMGSRDQGSGEKTAREDPGREVLLEPRRRRRLEAACRRRLPDGADVDLRDLEDGDLLLVDEALRIARRAGGPDVGREAAKEALVEKMGERRAREAARVLLEAVEAR